MFKLTPIVGIVLVIVILMAPVSTNTVEAGWMSVASRAVTIISKGLSKLQVDKAIKGFVGFVSNGVAWECLWNGCRLEDRYTPVASLNTRNCQRLGVNLRDVRVNFQKVAVVGSKSFVLSSSQRIGCVTSSNPFAVVLIMV